jgi:biopolymer transport protein ExbB/TolQ
MLNLAEATVMTAIVAVMCFVPGGLIVTIPCVIAIILASIIKMVINKKSEDLFRASEQSEVDRLEKIIESSTKDFESMEYELRQLKDERDTLQTQISGAGLKKRRGRPKGSGIAFKDNIDHAKGIQPVKKYHPFGKYFVNSHKLNNGNVLSINMA